MEIAVYKDLASSSDNTWAFFARSRARIQSLTRAASRASETKLRTLEARSVCAAFKLLPCVASKFRSAMPRLWPVCCFAAVVTSAVNSGTIMGASGLPEPLFSAEELAAPRGLAGTPRAAAIAEGGGRITNWSSGPGSTGVSSPLVGAVGSFGLACTAVPQPNEGFLRTALHPVEKTAAQHNTSNEIRAPERNGVR